MSSLQVAGDVFLVNFLSDTPDKVYMIIRQGEEDKVKSKPYLCRHARDLIHRR